jgi:hypothetical protein
MSLSSSTRRGGFRVYRRAPGPQDISAIAAPGHRLATLNRAGPADLDGEVLLLPEALDSGCAYRSQFERQLADRHITPRDALEFASIEMVNHCVVAGMGVSALSFAVEADVAAGNLVRLPWRGGLKGVHASRVLRHALAGAGHDRLHRYGQGDIQRLTTWLSIRSNRSKELPVHSRPGNWNPRSERPKVDPSAIRPVLIRYLRNALGRLLKAAPELSGVFHRALGHHGPVQRRGPRPVSSRADHYRRPRRPATGRSNFD